MNDYVYSDFQKELIKLVIRGLSENVSIPCPRTAKELSGFAKDVAREFDNV